MPLRNTYVAQRALARMKQRAEAIVLRRVSLLAGPEPFKNPPDVSGDLTVVNAGTYGSPPAPYFNLGGSSVIGRLVAGDQIVCAGSPSTPWTVLTMPETVLTNSDGIPQVDDFGAPEFGTPPVYNADTLGWVDSFPVVAVGDNDADPTTVIGQAVSFIFAADTQCYGKAMSYRQMTQLGWVEIDGIGLLLAAHLIPNPPQVNDQILLTSSGGEKRAIITTGRQFIDGTQFLYPVQAA